MKASLPTANVLLVDLASKQMHDHGLTSIQGRLFAVTIDDTWSAQFNGHSSEHAGIPPAHVAVTRKGMLFTILGPTPGLYPTLGGRREENELIDALKRAGAEIPAEFRAVGPEQTEPAQQEIKFS